MTQGGRGGGVWSAAEIRCRATGLSLLLICTCLILGGPAASAQTPMEAPDVEVMRELFLLTRGPGGVLVLHMIHLVNAGPRIATAVPLTVPEGAQWLAVDEELIREAGRAVDPRPLAVGESRRYALEYEIPWQRLPMAIRRPVLYPTRELLLWVPADELELRGVNVQFGGRQLLENVELDVYFTGELAPHPAWQVVLDSAHSRADRLPVLTPAGQRSDPVDILRTHPLPRLLIGALLVVGVVGVVRRLAARRGPAGSWPGAEGGVSVRAGASRSVGASGSVGGSGGGGGGPGQAGAAVPSAQSGAAVGSGGADGSGGAVGPGGTDGLTEAGGSWSQAADLAGAGRHASATAVFRPENEPAIREEFNGNDEIARLKEEIVRLDVAYDSGELDGDVYKARRDKLKRRLLALMDADKMRGAPGGGRP